MANTVYTTNPKGFSFVNTDGQSPRLLWGKAHSAMKAGDLVINQGTTGRIALHTAAGDENILGVCQNDCSAQDDDVSYIPALPHYLFEAEYSVASADIHALKGVRKEVVGTTGVMAIGAGTTKPIVHIVDYAMDYLQNIGDTASYPRVIVQIYKTVWAQIDLAND